VPAPAPAQPVGPGFGSIEPGPAPFDLRRTGSAAKLPEPPKGESLDEAFAGFTAPSREIEPKAGAVDIRKVRPAAPPPPPAVAAKDPCAKEVPAKGAKLTKGKAALAKDAKCVDPKETKAKEGKAQPSRIWVQVATGRDKSALGFDWRKLARDNSELFKGLKPGITAWGQSNRLLAGPFATQKEAAAFLAKLKKAGISGAFVWSSPAGQVVDALGGGK